ncbi:RHS repeat-associated core domain-containing protein [Pseudomonas sp. NFACC10-1]|uniref:RHS repeat-associated core domain-containing protein n=1 Tax=Pseudomonas sp. NFACC10-1 TaxID=1566247 RepID=UPI000908616B|nr:RHS repeat-associated core domain-containing protein [Pseudomonas sp. NFACC10-1]SFW54285.1 RHS repeat-associated core domain-containing protein [Pseudomonas sp. NFACC10-1]
MDDTPETRRVLCRYRYDALDRIAVVDPEAQEALSRFYQKNRLTVEIQGATRRCVFHGEDRLLAEYEADGAAERVDLLGTDRQNSVLQAVGSQERQPLAYSPYGHRAQGGPFSGFNGERADPVTGHYLLGNGYRAFNPVLMRFNRPDSLSPFGRGGLNAYAYCQGDPVNRSDPGGHISSFRVLGLTMFPKKTHFQRLPNEVLAKIIENLPLKAANNLAETSRSMREKVFGLIKKPWINVGDPDELLTIRKMLSNKTDLSPAMLKNDTFTAQFERSAANIKQGMDKEIKSLGRRAQSILDDVARVPGASYSQFQNAVARNRRAHAASIEILESIDGVVGEHRRLDESLNSLIHREADMGRLVASIRAELNRR